MSIKKWFFKNGIGSVGHSVKTTCDVYNSAISLPMFKNIPFEYVLMVKKDAWMPMNIFSRISSEQMIDYSEDCLALLAFEIVYIESVALQQANNKDFDIALDVIYEIVQQRHLKAIKNNKISFKQKAEKFPLHYYNSKYIV